METIEGNWLKLTTKVNGLYVPASSLETLLPSFSSLLCIWNHDEHYPFSLLGSSTLVRFRGRFYAICSMHQVKNVQRWDVCLLTSDCRAVTSSTMLCYEDQYNERKTDAYDLVAFDFTEAVAEGALLKSDFFSFEAAPSDCLSNETLAWIVAGYPFADQNYDLADAKHLGTTRRVLIGTPDHQPTDECLLAGTFVESLASSPDGLSGGPVFSIQSNESGQIYGYLCGLLLRAGRRNFYFLKAGFMADFLHSISD